MDGPAIIDKLRKLIDAQDGIRTEIKEWLQKLARWMHETKQWKQHEICRKIKYVLKDKIDEGKITGRWIEKCLPEYTRGYNKSEVSSLSLLADILEKQQLHDEEISNEFMIPKEKYEDLKVAMDTSKNFIRLVFKNGILQCAVSDTARA